VIMQIGSLKQIGHLPSWIFKIRFLITTALERPIVHHLAEFHGVRSCRCRDFEIFHIFVKKIKTLEVILVQHNFVKVRVNRLNFRQLPGYKIF